MKSFNYQNYLLKESCERTCTEEYNRDWDCDLLIKTKQQSCSFCKKRSHQLKSEKKKKIKHDAEPAKLKAPISATSPDHLILTLKPHRLRNKELENYVEKIRFEIDKCGTAINESLEKDLISIFSNVSDNEILNFKNLFWEEQQKYLQQNKTGRRYHPMIIKYCLSLAAKFSSAYSELRYDSKTGNGVLVLSSLRTFRNYQKTYSRFQSYIYKILIWKKPGFFRTRKMSQYY